MPASPSKPKLLVTRRLPDAVEARASRDFQATLNSDDHPRDGAEIIRASDGMDAILCCPTDPMNAETFAKLPSSVRMVATFSVGYDHIDLAAAKARGIAVSNTPDVLTDATADVAVLCMLGAARRAREGAELLARDAWTGWTPTQLMGTEVTGKRLGLIGMGRIGQAFAERARAFRMSIHYHNRRPLPDHEAAGAIFHDTLDSLLAVSDFLSLHCPLTPETRHLINARTIDKLPKGAILINTARGPVIDDEAVMAALKSGRLAAAGLDVFDGEPRINPGYRSLPNAFILPHLGSGTVETRNAMGFKALDNLDAFFAGQPLPDPLA